MAHLDLKPQQERSRRTLERLLEATEVVLEKHGLEGATIPRIAAQAKVTPGSVYRRFPDKEALLQAAILNFMERAEKLGALQLDTSKPSTIALFGSVPLPKLVESIVASTIKSYQIREGLLRSIVHYAMKQPGSKFWRQMEMIESRTIERAIKVLLLHRKSIRHPDPEFAVRMALLNMIYTLRDIM